MSFKDPDKAKEYYRRYRETHKKELYEQQKAWRHTPKGRECRAAETREHRRLNPGYHVVKTREYRLRLRLRVVAYFGGKCVRCGFSDYRALQVDHIYGGGRKEFAGKRPSAVRYHNGLLKEKPGEKYQLLCANCNQIKKDENKEFAAWYAPGTSFHKEYKGKRGIKYEQEAREAAVSV